MSDNDGDANMYNIKLMNVSKRGLAFQTQSIPIRAVEAPKKKAGKKAPATGACRRLLRRLYIVNAA